MRNHAVAHSLLKKKDKVVSGEDLGGWGSAMSYIILDLGRKVFIKLDLAADYWAICTVSGADGRRNVV
jgi:hypothetical protein